MWSNDDVILMPSQILAWYPQTFITEYLQLLPTFLADQTISEVCHSDCYVSQCMSHSCVTVYVSLLCHSVCHTLVSQCMSHFCVTVYVTLLCHSVCHTLCHNVCNTLCYTVTHVGATFHIGLTLSSVSSSVAILLYSRWGFNDDVMMM